MENTKATSKKKPLLSKLPKWVPSVAIFIVVVMGLFAVSAIIKSASKNPAEKLFDNYISAVKSQNAKKYASLFYKKGTEEYSEMVDNYSEGKDAYKTFLNENEEESAEYDDFWNAARIDFRDPAEYGLHLWVESQLANGIKDYVATVIKSNDYYIELSITINPDKDFDGSYLPLRYRERNGTKIPQGVIINACKVDGQWVFGNSFSIYKANRQDALATWYVPFEDGDQLMHVGYTDVVNGVFDLTKGTFEDKNIVSIGDYAFEARANDVKKVILPNNLKNIGKYAFKDCENLTEIVFEDGSSFKDKDITINEGAFYRCRRLTSFELPKSITTIEPYLFYGCSSLTRFDIEPTVNSIGHYAFYGCEGLTSINLPKNLITLGDGAFEKCNKLVTLNDDGNKLSNSIIRWGKSIFKDCTSLTTVVLPEGLIEINSSTFENCTNLKNIGLPQSLKRIGNSAFAKTGIEEIRLPKNVETIGKRAFSECANLSEFNWNQTTDGKDDTKIRIIGESAFSGSSSLYRFTLPQSLKSLGTAAFSGCSNLRYVYLDCNYNIDMGEGVFSQNGGIPKLYTRFTGEGYLRDDENDKPINGDINLFAFTEKTSNWNRLQLEIYSQSIIKDNMAILTKSNENTLVQYIGNDANVTLSKIDHINRGAFAHNTHIRKLSINSAEIKSIGPDVFDGCSPDFQFDRYKSTDNTIVGDLLYIGDWLIYGSAYKIGGEDNLFSGKVLDLGSATTFRLQGDSSKAPTTFGIADMAFAVRSSSVNLEEINLPSSIKYIGDEAFSGTSLKKLNFEGLNQSKLEHIGDGAFERCILLKEVALPESLKVISDNAFYGCESLRYVKLNSPETTVGKLAFEFSYSISKNLDTGVETEVREFYYDTLKIYIKGYDTNDFYKNNDNWVIYQDFTYDDKIIQKIGTDDFAVIGDTIIQYLGNSTLLTIDGSSLPIKKIGAGAFAGSYIEGIKIGADITTIEKNAFYRCERLLNVEMLVDAQFKNSLIYIGNLAFAKCTALSDITETDAAIDMLDLVEPHKDFTMGSNVFDESLNRRIFIKKRANFVANEYWAAYGQALNSNDDPSIRLEFDFEEGFEGDAKYQNGHEWVNIRTGEEIKREPNSNLLATALPDGANGYEFVGWYKNTKNGEFVSDLITESFTFGLAENSDVYVAVFKRTRSSLTVNVLTTGGTAKEVVDGKAEAFRKPYETKRYNVGDVIHLRADVDIDANYEYSFVGWFWLDDNDNEVSSANINHNYTVTANDFTIEARFAVVKSKLSVVVDSGAANLDGGNVDATFDDGGEEFSTGMVAPGTHLTLVAQNNAGYKFMGWYLNGAKVGTAATYSFTKGNNVETITARFRKILTISFDSVVYDGTEYTSSTIGGTHSVTNTAGESDYIHENIIELVATETTDYKFYKWQYKLEGTDSWVDVPEGTATMEEFSLPLASEIRAVFMLASVLTIEVQSDETGSVNIETGKQIIGHTIRLVASAADRCVFEGWYIDGVLISKEVSYNYTVTDQDVTIVAKFAEED